MKGLLTMVFLAVAANGATGVPYLANKPLAGLKELCVEASFQTKDAPKARLSTEEIQTRMELRMRKEGFAIANLGDLIKAALSHATYDDGAKADIERVISSGTLRLEMWIDTYETTLVFYHLRLSVQQTATVHNGGGISAVTWEAFSTGHVGTLNAPTIRDDVDELMDKFLNEYYTENPVAPKPRIE